MPAQVAVGEQELYALSEEHPVTVANAGAVPVQVTAVTPSGEHGADLQVTGEGCSAHPLAPGQSCEVRFVFAPQGPGRARRC